VGPPTLFPISLTPVSVSFRSEVNVVDQRDERWASGVGSASVEFSFSLPGTAPSDGSALASVDVAGSQITFHHEGEVNVGYCCDESFDFKLTNADIVVEFTV
jgi:hypothetical protein